MKVELLTFASSGWQELTVNGVTVAEGTDLPLDTIYALLEALQVDIRELRFDQ